MNDKDFAVFVGAQEVKEHVPSVRQTSNKRAQYIVSGER